MLSTTFSENTLALAHTQYVKRKGFIKKLSCFFSPSKINHIFFPRTEKSLVKDHTVERNHHVEAAEISFMISVIFLWNWSEPHLFQVNCVLFVTVVIVLQQLQAFFSQIRSTCILMINVIFNISGQHSKIYNPLSQAQHALFWARLSSSRRTGTARQPRCTQETFVIQKACF